MAQAASMDRYLGAPAAAPSAERDRHWWRSWEVWLTLALAILVQIPVVGSLQSSNWVSEMPSLLAPAAAGLTAAWLLAHTRLAGAIASLAGLATGAVTTIALVLQSMRLSDPAASGLGVRWAEFRVRMAEWFDALIHEGISTDPLPFVVLLIACVYLVAYVSTWAVARWRNPWLALIPGGFVLLTNISYLPGQPSFSFVIFVLAAVLLVARLTFLRSAERWQREGVAQHEFMSFEVLVAGAVIAGVLVFVAWTVPTANHWGPVADLWGRAMSPVTDRVNTIGQVFIGVGSKKPVPVHTLGTALPLQGQITLDSDVLYEVVADEPVNLRGAVYDEYTGTGWRVSSAAATDPGDLSVDAAQVGTPSSRAAIREPHRVQVTVIGEGAPDSALLSAGDPIATDTDAQILLDPSGSPLALVPRSGAGEGSTYVTVGTRSVAAIPTLQGAGSDYPSTVFNRYTALPDDLPPEIAELAHSVAAGATTPYDAARLIEEHLRANYQFTYDVPRPPARRDAVAHFLFDERRGYFDQFSSAMVVMLRSIGVPARVAAGFALDDVDLDPTTKAYSVTEQRAWSWPEVFFPGLGWVEFNPTPTRDTITRPGDDTAARDEAALGDLDFLGYDLSFEETFEGSESTLTPEELEALLERIREGEAEGATLVERVVGWVILASAAALVLVIAVRLWWERQFRGLGAAEKRWGKTMLLARLAGLRPSEDRTAMEVARDLGGRIGSSAALEALARSFSATRYGGPAGAEASADASLDDHYRAARRTLRRLIWRRVMRLGRVSGGPLTRWHPAPALRR